MIVFFFFKQETAYEVRISDWSSDVCSSDLLIGRQHGQTLAHQVSEQFIHDRIREPHDHQRMELRARLGVSHPKLISVIGEMELHLEEPLSQTDLAERAGLSTRQLDRKSTRLNSSH